MDTLYYNPLTKEATTNVCGYGNHSACDSKLCQCTQPFQHGENHGLDSVAPSEPEPETTSDSLSYA